VIPLSDSIQPQRTPIATYTIILINVLVFIYNLLQPEAMLEGWVHEHALIPVRLLASTGDPLRLVGQLGTLFSSMFIHAGWMHLLGNLWFLWIFGDNVEDRLGHLGFVAFYLMMGLVAAFSEVLGNPDGNLAIVGASGAIAGVLGAYLWWYPGARVRTMVPLIFIYPILDVPALLFLGLWLAAQVMGSIYGESGVAWFAHISGFVAGFLFSLSKARPRETRRRVLLRRSPWGR
jgi:membrane associated rhomboid family serine protease